MAIHANIDYTQFIALKQGALDQSRITGLTHNFYRYPARFSPSFVRVCIKTLSRPGDRIFDPYMGGGTTPLEAMALGRKAYGCDINSLSVFIARSKTTLLTKKETNTILDWTKNVLPIIKCKRNRPQSQVAYSVAASNLSEPKVLWIGKFISAVLDSISETDLSPRAERFVRCALLNTGQWALNGRYLIPTVPAFRKKLFATCLQMLDDLSELRQSLSQSNEPIHSPALFEMDAQYLSELRIAPMDLVITSPPYPGVHALYHRWQVDGRRETDAPYWISNCTDGSGAAYYSFADRQAEDRYFDKALKTFTAIRAKMKPKAFLVQLVAFSDRNRQLPKYLRMLDNAGFTEVKEPNNKRIWRPVPGRSWHATLKGKTAGSREVVLIHAAS